MKKRLVALMTAACLVMSPVSVLAEETDYSYLEDMSVKELRELRDEINKILNDTVESDVDIEDKEKPPLTDVEKDVVDVLHIFNSGLKNPRDFKLYRVHVTTSEFDSYDSLKIWFDYSGTNSYGAEVNDYIKVNIMYDKGASVTDKLMEDLSLFGFSFVFSKKSSYDPGSYYEELDAERIQEEVLNLI